MASLALFVTSAWVLGETILSRWAIGNNSNRWPLASALGWGLIAQGMFLLGIIGQLNSLAVLGLLALGHLLSVRTWHTFFSGGPRWSPRIALLGGVLLPCFLLTLYPPTGFDATVYHLSYARAFVESGHLEFLPDLRFPVFPQVAEMGFVLGFLTSGENASRLTQLLATIWTAGLLLNWGRLYSQRAGHWAAALWLGNPLIIWLGTSAYIDVTLALFITAALYCWDCWQRHRDSQWLWLAATFAGLAAATKYLGLFFLAALGFLTAWQALKSRMLNLRTIADPLWVLGVGALAMMAPWYLRIIFYTGNPVFPFYAPIFGHSEWTTLHDQALPTASAHAGTSALWAVVSSQGARVAEGLLFLLQVPWTAVFDRGVFHWQAPLSPYYLLLLPLCAPLALIARNTRWLILLVTIYGLFWLTTVRDLRFLVAALPALNVALAVTTAAWIPRFELRVGRWKQWTTPLVTLALLTPGPLYAAYKLYEYRLPPVGHPQRDAYLTRQIPGFPAIAMMNDLEGRDYTVYTLYGENLRYYADGRFLGDWFGPARFSRIAAVINDSEALTAELKSLGACFFLVRQVGARPLLPSDAKFRSRFQRLYSEDGFALYRVSEIPCHRRAPKAGGLQLREDSPKP